MSSDEAYKFDLNIFYKSLKSRYKKQFEIVQEQSGVVCIPLKNLSEERLQISNFVFKHLFIPSPFLKNLYVSIFNQDFDLLFMESNCYSLLATDKMNKIKFAAKIIDEHIGYAIDNKSYKIVIIEYPLFEYKKSYFDSKDVVQNEKQIPFSFYDISKIEKSSEYLTKVSHILNEYFKHEVKIFRKTYVLLSYHLKECVEEFYKIHKTYLNQFLQYIDGSEDFLSLAIENYLNGSMYNKIWSMVIELNSEKDNFIHYKLNQICNIKMSYFLKLNEKYLINYNLSIQEITKIHLFKTVFEKLICMKTCIELISTELNLYYNAKNDTLEKNQLNLTSDELLPLCCYVIIKAKLKFLYSLIFFTEKFNLSATYAMANEIHMHSLNELSFVHSTFKAAICLIERYIN